MRETLFEVLLAWRAIALGATLMLLPMFAAAQSTSPLVNCFDYYHFGSVQAHLNASIARTISGVPITFSGTLENTNPYPVVDGALYVKVFRKGAAADLRNGPDVVDQFFVKEGIVIPANSSVPVSFEWRVPSYAQSGDYMLAAFFTTDKKFNLLGLSFTDDVTGNTVDFKVSGEREGAVGFDKQSVLVNGDAYHFAEFPPRATEAEPISVETKLVNTSDEAEPTAVQWELYAWDAQSPENRIARSEATIVVPARGSVPVSYTINDKSTSVYLLVGTVVSHDAKSVINVRIVRDGIDRLRLNFPSLASFPLEKDTPATLFTCFSNSADRTVKNGRLEISLNDKSGRSIHSFGYQGAITGRMMGAAEQFTPARSYDDVTVVAKLYDGDMLVDQASVHYDCAAIEGKPCASRTPWLAYAATLFVLTAGAYVLYRRRFAMPAGPE